MLLDSYVKMIKTSTKAVLMSTVKELIAMFSGIMTTYETAIINERGEIKERI